MKLMGKRSWILLVLCMMFGAGLLFFIYAYVADGADWATYPVNSHLYSGGRLTRAGDILDRDGIVLATTTDGKRTFSASSGVRRAALHLTGDAQGNIATGLQVTHRRELTGWNHFTGAYSYGGAGNSITTTVDAGLGRTALEAMDGRKGTVGVINYKTGEIICMVSLPTFDPEDPPDVSADPERWEGAYINRLLSAAYVPGSIFKLVTTAAALERLPGAMERSFVCEGSLKLDGGLITCPKAHGEQNIGRALTNSCNCFYAQLALDIGGETLEKYARSAGVGGTLSVDGIKTARGSFTLEGAHEVDIGWAGVGQFKTQVNPLAFLQYVGSIANGGARATPRIIKSIQNEMGVPTWFGLDFGSGASMSEAAAAALREMMRANVTGSYGEGGLAGYDMCAKSGTAEVGGGKQPHAWFTGFLDSEEAPLAFIVIVENGGAGSSAAAQVATKVLREAVKLQY